MSEILAAQARANHFGKASLRMVLIVPFALQIIVIGGLCVVAAAFGLDRFADAGKGRLRSDTND